jgi:hypothetical protein
VSTKPAGGRSGACRTCLYWRVGWIVAVTALLVTWLVDVFAA